MDTGACSRYLNYQFVSENHANQPMPCFVLSYQGVIWKSFSRIAEVKQGSRFFDRDGKVVLATAEGGAGWI
jgi:hypothetical protein